MAAGVVDLVANFIDHGGLVATLVVAVGVLAAYRLVARWLDTSELLAAAALVSIATILAITLGVRLLEDGGVGLGLPRLTCLERGDCMDRIVELDASWLLNLSIFVPAGFCVMLAIRRPVLTAIGLVALSATIELLQGTFGLGAPDPGDLVSNAVGAVIGTLLGAVALRALRLRTADAEHGRSPRTVLRSVLAGAAIAGFAWLALATAANVRRQSLADDVREAFAGTTATDIASALATPDGVTRLFSATGTPPGYLGEVGATGAYEARYSTQFFGFDRCVFARWDAAGFSLTNGSGHRCTVFRERPPE